MSYLEQGLNAYNARDYETAKQIFTRLANLNQSPQAHCLLGLMHSNGQGFVADPAAAAYHYQIAAEAGHPQAAYNLAALYAQGRGVEKDYTVALSWYINASQAGEIEAAFIIGTMYAQGEGVAQDFDVAQQWWMKAAAQNHELACLYIGHLYNYGDGREVDPISAANWYLKAWDTDFDEAEPYIVNLLPKLKDLADLGSTQAQAALGAIYLIGYADYSQAVSWLTLAAAQNHPEAMRLLGYCYLQGEGVNRDETQALDLYRRAAEQGDKFAQFKLAAFYAQGYGHLEQNIDAAIHWCRQAAQQEVFDAQYALAQLLAQRNRNRADAVEAIKRICNYAQQNPTQTEYQLTAGDGEWSVVVAAGGKVVSLVGIEFDELTAHTTAQERTPD
ncbi:tetratricopeptide repeat protein [Nostoc sp. MS1]|uniref:tetratricopeptide repeat protein n=1 Tax=Nostoc sp. MS1 TaxID=2764711 RepID=UPI001CC5A899|nr:SEL1-like repeat protein [Nostoc sp. MS1]BCL40070.1 hypothetical protein NSMS1_65170 [Nostoc sp. MS1]